MTRSLRVVSVGVAITLLATVAGASIAPGTPAQVAALVKAATKITKLPSNLTPSLGNASTDTATTEDPSLAYCVTGAATLSFPCLFGDTHATKTMVLWGDSHAEMWFPALNAVAKKAKWRLVALINLGCPFASIAVAQLPATPGNVVANTNCVEFRQNMIARINALDPQLVVLSESFYTIAADGTSITTAQWKTAVGATLKSLSSKGTKKVVIGNTILIPNPVTCLAANPTNLGVCRGGDSTTYAAQRTAESSATIAAKAKYINEIPWECTKSCTDVVGNMVVYYSPGHITATYSAYLATVLYDTLKSTL